MKRVGQNFESCPPRVSRIYLKSGFEGRPESKLKAPCCRIWGSFIIVVALGGIDHSCRISQLLKFSTLFGNKKNRAFFPFPIQEI
jgi:hypothetical protein